MIVAACIAGWLGCGVLAYGLTYGYFMRHWRRDAYDRRYEHIPLAVAVGLMGPLGVTVAYLMGERAHHGLLFTFEEARLQATLRALRGPLTPQEELDDLMAELHCGISCRKPCHVCEARK